MAADRMDAVKVAIVQAGREGAAAYEAGLPPQECPYDPKSADASEALLAKYWIKGYSKH